MSPPVKPPENLLCEAPMEMSALMMSRLGIDRERALWLMEFGAVYHNRERAWDDRWLDRGDWVRVHVSPRRFPASAVAWNERIVREEAEFVVVNKPAGIPVHPTCDNAVENVLAQIQKCLGPELKIVQRLDVATQGLMMLAKTKPFVHRFARALEERRVVKRYRALVPRELPCGPLLHYMKPSDCAPRTVDTIAHEGWKPCLLTIDEVRARHDGAFELTVTLGTGRMHQIRCQLSALGAPILGDTLYGSRAPSPSALGEGDVIALQSCALSFEGTEVSLSSPW